jgi:hypothetical protein
MGGDVSAMAEHLCELAECGAAWAVCAWPESLEAVAEAAQLARTG